MQNELSKCDDNGPHKRSELQLIYMNSLYSDDIDWIFNLYIWIHYIVVTSLNSSVT